MPASSKFLNGQYARNNQILHSDSLIQPDSPTCVTITDGISEHRLSAINHCMLVGCL